MNRPVAWTANRKFFKSLVEASDLLGWICDHDGYCVYLSPSWYSYTGAENAEGLNWLNYIHVDDRSSTRRAVYEAIDAQQNFVGDFRFLRADGKFVVATGHGSPHYDDEGSYLGLIGVVKTAEQFEEQGRETSNNNPSGSPDRLPLLTTREKQVLELFAEGYTAETAAVHLGISQSTVSGHANRAVTKLGALNRTHAVIRALKLNELALDRS